MLTWSQTYLSNIDLVVSHLFILGAYTYPAVFLLYACGGAWFALNFHVLFKTSFLRTRVLFGVLCSGVSISLLGLCVKLMETVLQLVVLAATVTMGPGSVRLVRIVVLVIEFSLAWIVLPISIVCVGLSAATGMILRIGRYCYC